MRGQLSVELILIGVLLLALVAIIGAKLLTTTKNTTNEFESRSTRVLEMTNFTKPIQWDSYESPAVA